MFRFAQPDNYFESNSRGCAIQLSKPIMNNQQATDKAGTPRRPTIMNNEAQSIYGLLVGSEERGRSTMETAVYAVCMLSVVAAILQFVSQPTPDPFARFATTAQPVPVVSHTVRAVWNTRSQETPQATYAGIGKGCRAAPGAKGSGQRGVPSNL